MDEELGATDVTALAAWPTVTLPAEMDITNAGHVEDELRASFAPGVAVVIADMTHDGVLRFLWDPLPGECK